MKKFFVLIIMIASIFGLQAQNTITNSDFEIWSYGKPVNWSMGLHGYITSVINIPVEVNFGSQSNIAHSGNSAIKLASADFTIPYMGYSFNLPGILQAGESEGFSIPLTDILNIIQMFQDTTGFGGLDGLDSMDISSLSSLVQLLSKGVPCSSTPAAVSAWARYIPQEGDQLVMFAMTKKEGIPVDYTYKTFSGADTSTYHQIGVGFSTPNAECDSIMVLFMSSQQLGSTSVLYIDDVALEYSGTGISTFDNFPGSVYPNPATDHLQIRPDNDRPYVWTLTDMSGKTLMTGEASGETSIDTRDCATGMYLLHLNGDGISGTRKIMIR